LEELHVCLVVVSPLLWEIIFVVDGFDGAHWFACATVHTLIRVDVKHTVTFVDAIYGALIDAGTVFDIYTWQGDDVGQGGTPLSKVQVGLT
jgi:hypothetical protein